MASMLLHLNPTLFLRDFGTGKLIDLTIEPLGLYLRGSAELATRRPYPNKRLFVACRRQRLKPVHGLLIELPRPVSEFHTCARWAVDAELLVTHHVDYRIIDQDFDAASDQMSLWYGAENLLWSSRWPEGESGSPAQLHPQMEVSPPASSKGVRDKRNSEGLIIERHHEFTMPTLERARILANPYEDKMPALQSAFRVDAAEPPQRAAGLSLASQPRSADGPIPYSVGDRLAPQQPRSRQQR